MSENDEQPQIARDDAGRFLPGQGSPNPGGKSHAWRAARQVIDAQLNDLIETCVFMALHGSESHMRMLLDRAFPALKPGAEPVEVEGLANAKPQDRPNILLTAVGNGELDADSAAKLLQALSAAEQMAVLEELKERLAGADQSRDLL